MARLFIRLWLITGASFLMLLIGLNSALDYFYQPKLDQVFIEQVRGQVYALREGLQGHDAEQQREQLRRWQPHYGITLQLLQTPPRLTAAEQQQLRQHRFVVRDGFELLLFPIEADSGRWLSARLPGEISMAMHMTVIAQLIMLSLLGLIIYAWARGLWRDLEVLRAHADRIGAGDLQARAVVSKRSQIRSIVDHANRMAARVADLVQRQRDLIHALSHELRTPIARLSFGVDLLEQSRDPARRSKLSAGLRTDIAELNQLVNELLSYERLGQAGNDQPWQPIDAQRWLQASLLDAQREAELAGIELSVVAATTELVPAQPRPLQLALSNLVRNGLRHAQQRVEVSLLADADGYCLRIDDDGSGIAAIDRERVLQPFARLDDSRSRDTGGFGLGLAISQRIAERHHGCLRVLDAAIGGARLELRWPRHRA